MKYIVTFLFIITGLLAKGQEVNFETLEKKINEHVASGRWDEVLLMAPDLMIEEPTRGEGYYYTALAFFNLNDLAKAKEYVGLSEALADEGLKVKLKALKSNIEEDSGANQVQERIKQLLAQGNQTGAANEWTALWKKDRSNVKYALNAIELYTALKMYPEALEILMDNALANDSNAKILYEKINSTPEMNKLNGYTLAMKEGNALYNNSSYQSALSKFNAALGFMRNDAEATRMKRLAEDELAWQSVERVNDFNSYEKYIVGNTLKKYRQEAIDRITRGLISYGEKAAKEGDIALMEHYLIKLRNTYPSYEADRVKKVMCDTYFREANKLSASKTGYEQQRRIELLTKYNALCGPSAIITKAISKAEGLKVRYTRPDRFFISYMYDTLTTTGFSMGTLNNRKVGIYLHARFNDAGFQGSSSSFAVNAKGTPDGPTGSYTFNGTKKTGALEFGLGLTKKIAWPLWVYAAGGISLSHEYWQFTSSSGDDSWIQNTESKATKGVYDAGLIVDVGGFNIRGGGKTYDFKTINYTVGIGVSL